MAEEVHFPPSFLPDLALNSSNVPGGLSADLAFVEPVDAGGHEWTVEDASRSPIGYMLAVETACKPDEDVPQLDTSNS